MKSKQWAQVVNDTEECLKVKKSIPELQTQIQMVKENEYLNGQGDFEPTAVDLIEKLEQKISQLQQTIDQKNLVDAELVELDEFCSDLEISSLSKFSNIQAVKRQLMTLRKYKVSKDLTKK